MPVAGIATLASKPIRATWLFFATGSCAVVQVSCPNLRRTFSTLRKIASQIGIAQSAFCGQNLSKPNSNAIVRSFNQPQSPLLQNDGRWCASSIEVAHSQLCQWLAAEAKCNGWS